MVADEVADESSPAPRRLWLAGLRRGWNTSGALARWIADRGVGGVVWTPASYEVDDVAEALGSLVQAGARPDASLLWDLAVLDVRAAAEALRPAHSAAAGTDGFVVVWLDPARANDGGKAVATAGELIGEIRRPNVAVGLAWSGARAGVVQALVGAGIPVALSAVRDDAARRAVTSAHTNGIAKLRASAEAAEESAAVVDVPVFLLGSQEGGEDLYGVDLTTEFGLFGSAPSAARVPLSADAEQSGFNAAVERLVQRSREPVRDDSYTSASFAQAVVRECAELQEDEVLEDIWARDYEIWKDDPTEIADRLGWLDIPERMHSELGDVTEFGRKTRAGSDIAHVVVCGMGGSVFACEMFSRILGGAVPLTVLDSTHPEYIDAVTSSLDLERTLFVVSSKSGTTIETRSHLEYFWSLVGRGDRFVAITDPGTELAALAASRGFARVFENDPTIGGRFSGLSYFGLVPASLAGVDIESLVNGARRAIVRNAPGVGPSDAPGARLGAALGEAAANESRDKLTLVLPPELSSFEVWTEQLIAESLGKEGRGIVPVTNEPLGSPDAYGSDRLFCVYTAGESPPPAGLEPLAADHPIINIRVPDTRRLGAEMYRWEIAVAIVGYHLDINPFDQPDVESAKRRAREALERPPAERPDTGSARELLEAVASPQYVALQAFIKPTPENAARLETVRARLRDRSGVAVTVGFGPRFLHSTGQLHKGGPGTGVFLQITEERSKDIDVPGMGFSFGRLFDAQADGDLQALRDAGRPVARVSLSELEGITAQG